MLIDLPPLPVHEYSMADCQDLFYPRSDDDFRINTPGVFKNDDRLAVPLDRGVHGHLSDAEPFTYTSSSDSDADMYFSDIDVSRAGRRTEPQSQTSMSSSVERPEKNIALHSPGQLLGTPRDPTRRYEYPFPARLRKGGELDILEDVASSTATTPGLTPAEGSSLGLMSLAAPAAGILNRPESLSTYMQTSAPVAIQAPVPVPVPVPVQMDNQMIGTTKSLVPSSAPILGTFSNPASTTTSTIATHPKLARFNPADAPVPPGLRGRTRTRRSASVSTVQAPPIPAALPASVSVPSMSPVSAGANAVVPIARMGNL